MSGYKSFAAGERLFAADVNDFLMEQAVMTFADATARDAALTAVLREGMVAYLQDTDEVIKYDGSAWTQVGAEPGLVEVKTVVKTNTQSNSLASAARTGITGLTIAHSVADASHKVLLIAQISGGYDTGRLNAALTAGGSELNIGDASGSRTRVSAGNNTDSTIRQSSVILMALHTPGVTSSVTYGVNIINASAFTETNFVNRGTEDVDGAGRTRAASVLTLLEVRV